MTCNEEDTDGRARVTTDEERVLPEDCTLSYKNIFADWIFDNLKQYVTH